MQDTDDDDVTDSVELRLQLAQLLRRDAVVEDSWISVLVELIASGCLAWMRLVTFACWVVVFRLADHRYDLRLEQRFRGLLIPAVSIWCDRAVRARSWWMARPLLLALIPVALLAAPPQLYSAFSLMFYLLLQSWSCACFITIPLRRLALFLLDAPISVLLRLLVVSWRNASRRILSLLGKAMSPAGVFILVLAGLAGSVFRTRYQVSRTARLTVNRAVLRQLADSALRLQPVRVARQQTPNNFKCPITHDIMRDPVIAADGHSYEREAIERWLTMHREQNPRSPMGAGPLQHRSLQANIALRGAIEQFMSERPGPPG